MIDAIKGLLPPSFAGRGAEYLVIGTIALGLLITIKGIVSDGAKTYLKSNPDVLIAVGVVAAITSVWASLPAVIGASILFAIALLPPLLGRPSLTLPRLAHDLSRRVLLASAAIVYGLLAMGEHALYEYRYRIIAADGLGLLLVPPDDETPMSVGHAQDRQSLLVALFRDLHEMIESVFPLPVRQRLLPKAGEFDDPNTFKGRLLPGGFVDDEKNTGRLLAYSRSSFQPASIVVTSRSLFSSQDTVQVRVTLWRIAHDKRRLDRLVGDDILIRGAAIRSPTNLRRISLVASLQILSHLIEADWHSRIESDHQDQAWAELLREFRKLGDKINFTDSAVTTPLPRSSEVASKCKPVECVRALASQFAAVPDLVQSDDQAVRAVVTLRARLATIAAQESQ